MEFILMIMSVFYIYSFYFQLIESRNEWFKKRVEQVVLFDHYTKISGKSKMWLIAGISTTIFVLLDITYYILTAIKIDNIAFTFMAGMLVTLIVRMVMENLSMAIKVKVHPIKFHKTTQLLAIVYVMHFLYFYIDNHWNHIIALSVTIFLVVVMVLKFLEKLGEDLS